MFFPTTIDDSSGNEPSYFDVISIETTYCGENVLWFLYIL